MLVQLCAPDSQITAKDLQIIRNMFTVVYRFQMRIDTEECFCKIISQSIRETGTVVLPSREDAMLMYGCNNT